MGKIVSMGQQQAHNTSNFVIILSPIPQSILCFLWSKTLSRSKHIIPSIHFLSWHSPTLTTMSFCRYNAFNHFRSASTYLGIDRSMILYEYYHCKQVIVYLFCLFSLLQWCSFPHILLVWFLLKFCNFFCKFILIHPVLTFFFFFLQSTSSGYAFHCSRLGFRN